MTRFGWAVIVGSIGVIVLAVVAVFIWKQSQAPAPSVQTQATSSPEMNPSKLSIYTSGEYGFSFFYPSDAVVVDAYSSTTLAGVPWRVTANGTGTPIARIQKGNSELRIGMSTDPRETKVCAQVGPAETPVGPFTVGSVTWQKTSFQKLGTDNERRVTSYRTLHDRACYAVEFFEPLNNAPATSGYTISDIITSFTFAN